MAFDLLAVTKDKNNKRNCLGNDKKTNKKLKPNQIKARKHTQKNLRKQANKNRANKIGKHCPNHVQRMKKKNEIATKCN